MSWKQQQRNWHAAVGMFAAITLGVIAVSCFPIAHKELGGRFGKILAEIHMGKFLPENWRWIWIDSQGLFLGYLVVSGYLIHKKKRREVAELREELADRNRVLVLFGTETGNSEKLAIRFGHQLERVGVRHRVASMAQHGFFDLSKERYLCLITSTYGDGEMPSNATAFWDSLRSDQAPPLPQLRFAVLALGDRAYPEFCAAGHAFDARLTALGATQLEPCAECDIAFEKSAEAWMNRMTDGFLREFSLGSTSASNIEVSHSFEIVGPAVEPTKETAPPPLGSRQRPCLVELGQNIHLTLPGSNKETRHFEVDLNGSGVRYNTGDALGVQPENCPLLVERLLAALGNKPDTVVPTPHGDQSLSQALLSGYEIGRIPSALGDWWRQRFPDGDGARPGWGDGRDVIDLLESEPHHGLSALELVGMLRPLQPRLYSIASSPVIAPTRVALTVGAVRYSLHGRARQGVCSTYLSDRLRIGDQLAVFVHPSPHFRLPEDVETPVIMVGAGTGIAPFRGFIQERAEAGASKNWLFFGEQQAATDFFYRDELETWVKHDQLRLTTAFSRDQNSRIYVQDRMQAFAPELWKWIEAGAHFYVCGDAKKMARDVDSALVSVCRQAGGFNEEEAFNYVEAMRKTGRYKRDVY